VLAQRHVDGLRAGRRTDSLDDEPPARLVAAAPSVASSGKEPSEFDPDRARLLPRLRQAVAAALVTVAPADRLLLSLYYVQEMTLAQIAVVQGAHEATISRHLDRIRRELRKSVENSLVAGRTAENGAAQPGLSSAQVELCFGYALEDWAFDLDAALSGPAGEQEKI
jgi:DNA-directed RNA polymerase specialized sigma24 family protein